jgi:Uma2 family endonuclease
MATMTVMPSDGDWRVDDLDAIPADGLQYELVDGVLVVTPAPAPRHQTIVLELAILLHAACPKDLAVYVAPLDFRPDGRTSVQPDLMVVRREDVQATHISKPPLLAVEVLSPATRRRDLSLKRGLYEDTGVASFWVIDPDEPSLRAWDLADGRYAERAHVTGGIEASLEHPFPVIVSAAGLLGG